MIHDVQKQSDNRNIPFDRVGVKDLRYPITLMDRNGGLQHTVSSIKLKML